MRPRVLARLLSPLFLGFLVALVALVGFTRLADEMREGETKHFDETISRAIHGLTSPARTEITIKLTDIGNTTGVIVVAAIACVVLWFRHRPQGARSPGSHYRRRLVFAVGAETALSTASPSALRLPPAAEGLQLPKRPRVGFLLLVDRKSVV